MLECWASTFCRVWPARQAILASIITVDAVEDMCSKSLKCQVSGGAFFQLSFRLSSAGRGRAATLSGCKAAALLVYPSDGKTTGARHRLQWAQRDVSKRLLLATDALCFLLSVLEYTIETRPRR